MPDNYENGNDDRDNESMYMSFNEDIVRWTGNGVSLGLPPLQDTSGVLGRNSFGSAHAAGMNAAFCDGSVHLISYSTADWVTAGTASRFIPNRFKPRESPARGSDGRRKLTMGSTSVF